MHHSSSSSLVGGNPQTGSLPLDDLQAAVTAEQQQQQQLHQLQQRPHRLPLHASNTDVNGAALTKEVRTWNPFEDSFTQMSEDHLFGQEFDKIRQQGSQSSEWRRRRRIEKRRKLNESPISRSLQSGGQHSPGRTTDATRDDNDYDDHEHGNCAKLRRRGRSVWLGAVLDASWRHRRTKGRR